MWCASASSRGVSVCLERARLLRSAHCETFLVWSKWTGPVIERVMRAPLPPGTA